MKSPQSHSSSGTRFVLLFVGISVLAAAGTFWNYSRSVFSTNRATMIHQDGRIKALFSPAVIMKLHPHQQAKVTFKASTLDHEKIWPAEVITLGQDHVILQLVEKPKDLFLGESCDVTIDTTIPYEGHE